ncbi:MAG: hypothetical protein PWP23_1532 [Candidatus Sumerlaeota bacterium]|nr:hypothetical protein [Candidatus Sumerlaeota bacterium]
MRRIALILLSVIFPGLLLAADPPEFRGAYVPSFDTNTQAACDTVINRVLSSNLNQLFVQVRARGDAAYFPNREDSTYPNPEPRGELYSLSPADLDVLQYYIDELHNADPPVEVHAWMTTFNSWNRTGSSPSSPNHVYNAHPEWITEKESGVSYTAADDAPLDPGIPAVQDHIYNVFMDVVRNYDVDGIHFDYIRLLGADSGYDPVAKAQFLAETGWNYDTQNGSGQLDEVYEAWRRDQIAQLVQRVHAQTMLEKPWVEVSAFLVNFSDSVEVLGQGYNWWVAHDAIDVLHPGCYSSTVAGTVDDWDFYVNKLAQNGDQNRRPLIAAIGTYLLEDSQENLDAVLSLRGNSRTPDGFNYFQQRNLWVGGSPNADQNARDLFDAGGPMDEAAPLPVIAHKIALGEETTPPNPPASISITVEGGKPRVQFSRPAPASDGDLPVHYRLYRDTIPDVRLTYANMAMEWWDPGSPRTTFEFVDQLASGTVYYALVAYDDWNNKAVATRGPYTAATTEYIIETRTGGLNYSAYSESGTFSNSSAHSEAPGLTPSLGSRWALPGDANGRNDRARFTPTGLPDGTYDVFVTTYRFGSANALNTTVRFNDADGTRTRTFDLTAANCGDTWAEVGTVRISGSGTWVEFDNATQTNIGTSTDARMNAAAVKFESVASPATPKEPKPPVVQPTSTVTEVIADSTPQALDYDDNGNVWSTTTLSGYYNSQARYFSSGSFPMNDYAVWIIDLPRKGRWAIDGWTRHNTAFAQGARYRFVTLDGTVVNTAVSQRSTFDSTTTGDWLINVDGVADSDAYEFDKGRVYVTVWGNTAGSQTVIADALRFRLVEATDAEATSNWVIYGN